MPTILLTRDSVCAGDDADAPHERVLKLDAAELRSHGVDARLLDVMSFIGRLAPGYLPNVNGVGHCWSAYLNGKLLATVTVTGGWPHVDELNLEAENELYFKYHPATY